MEDQGKTIDEILALAADPAYHRVVTARIPFVPQELRDEHERLDALLPTLVSDTIDLHPDRVATARRIAELEAEIEAATIEFRFRNIGRRAWADLLRKHPPRKQDTVDYNEETFPAAAIAAACSDPAMTVDQVVALEASPLMDVKSWTDLWGACLRACVVEKSPKSEAASRVLRREELLLRRTTTESPAASSLDES